MLSYVLPSSDDRPNPFRPRDLPPDEGDDASLPPVEAVPHSSVETALAPSSDAPPHSNSAEGKQNLTTAVTTETVTSCGRAHLMSSSSSSGADNGRQCNQRLDVLEDKVDSERCEVVVLGSVTIVPSAKCPPPLRYDRKENMSSDVPSEERSPVSECRSVVSDILTTPGSEDRSISKFAKPNLKR